MNLNYKEQLPVDFDPASRVWIYQSSRMLSLGEALDAEERLGRFNREWQSHGNALKTAAFLFFGQFIVLMADETYAGVSGCSTDSSVRFIKGLEQTYQISLFDRTNLAFLVKNKVQIIPYSQVQYALEQGFIDKHTLYFNNLAGSKKELETNWILPLGESWLAQKLDITGN